MLGLFLEFVLSKFAIFTMFLGHFKFVKTFLFLPSVSCVSWTVCCAVVAGRRVWSPFLSFHTRRTMSADPACRPEPDSEHHAELADMVADMNMATSRLSPTNGTWPGPSLSRSPRPRLTDRKMSLQERGSRVARQPTIETKRVSITGIDVSSSPPTQDYSHTCMTLIHFFFSNLPQDCVQLNQYKLKNEIGKVIIKLLLFCAPENRTVQDVCSSMVDLKEG